MKATAISFSVLMFFSGCASSYSYDTGGNDDQSSAQALAAMMADVFETAPDDPDNDIRDRRVQLDTPDLPGVWLYYQLNTGPQKTVYRQRVIELIEDGDTVIQKTYGLNEPEAYADLWDKPALLNTISTADFEPYFDEGCEQIWRREGGEWRGAVNRETCRIFSERRQAFIYIEAEAELNETAYRQTERGYSENGEKLFGGEPGEFIVLYRQ